MRRRIDRGIGHKPDDFARHRVDFTKSVDLVAEKFHTNCRFARGRHNIDDVPANTEIVAFKRDVVPVIADGNEPARKLVNGNPHAGTQRQNELLIFLGVSERIDAGHARNDDHVPSFKQSGGRAVAEPVDLIVDGGILFNI